MARRTHEDLVCDLCDAAIPEPKAGGGPFQGGPIEVVLGGTKVLLDVCEECQTTRPVTLAELYERGSTAYGGTAQGAGLLLYMPVVERSAS